MDNYNRVIYTRPYDAEVEYLESDGNSYFNTGIKASSDIGILAEAQNNTSNFPYNWIFGGGEDYLINEFGFLTKDSERQSSFRFGSEQMKYTPLDNTPKLSISNVDNHNVLSINNLEYTTPFNAFTSSSNIYLFAFNRTNGSNVYKSRGIRIYFIKLYLNDILIRDFIPVRVGNIGYMYDKVSGKLFANQGIGNFILGADVANPVPKIRNVVYYSPYDAEVEYLQGNGNQYISTGISTQLIKEFTVKIATTKTVTDTFYCLGNDKSSGDYRFSLGYSERGFIQVRLGDYYNMVKYQVGVFNTITVNRSTGKYYIDGNNYNGLKVSDANTNPYHFIIFRAKSDYSLYSQKNSVRIASFSAKGSNDELLIDLIPVRKNGIGYMYDKVSGKLFGNKGIGNFILGNDVNNVKPKIRRVMPMPYDSKIEYLESTGTQYIDTLKFPHNVGKWELDIQYTQYIHQINGVHATNNERFDIGMNNPVVQWFIGFGIIETPYGSDLNRHKFLLDNINNQYCIDDNQYAVSHVNFTTQNSYSILIANMKYFNNPSSNYFCKEKIYSSKMWDINNNLIQDLIPVRRGNVGYLYDKVSGKLFGNAGTGQFILGNDIND